jgi:hypothetical protein
MIKSFGDEQEHEVIFRQQAGMQTDQRLRGKSAVRQGQGRALPALSLTYDAIYGE